MEDQQIFEKWEEFKRILKSTNREGIDSIIKWLDESDFKVAPASTQYHSSIKGGLLLHSLQVYYHMYDFNNLIQFFDIPNDTIAIVALLHDVCKVDSYNVSYRNTKNENGSNFQGMTAFSKREAISARCIRSASRSSAVRRSFMRFSSFSLQREISSCTSACPLSVSDT